MNGEVDLGLLARDESRAAGLQEPMLSAEEVVEDWVYFHLSCAQRSRIRMARMDAVTSDYIAEHRFREQAMEAAGRHLNMLRTVGYRISHELVQLIQAEGLK